MRPLLYYQHWLELTCLGFRKAIAEEEVVIKTLSTIEVARISTLKTRTLR